VTEERIRTGGCLCGDVRYSVRGEPIHVGRCHCANCRKESAGPYTIYGAWPVTAFEVTGELADYEGRRFCPRCGSRVFNGDPGATAIEIALGTLDDAPFELKPESELWIKRRESWIAPVEGARQWVENPVR